MISRFGFIFALTLIFGIVHSKPKNSKQQKCYALALEGGGDAGSYEAGALKALIENMPADQIQYDVVSGVSVGALNGLFISSYPKGEEIQMVENLVKIWNELESSTIYKSWGWSFLGDLQGFYNKPSVYDTSPFKEFLEQQTKNLTIYRKLTVGVTDATNMKKLVYYMDLLQNQDDIIDAIQSSTAMPFLFPYMKKDNTILIDGGVLQNLDVGSAVKRCHEIVDNDEDIIIDVIMTEGAIIETQDPSKFYTGWEMYQRYNDILAYKQANDDLLQAFYAFPNIKFRHIIMPLEDIGKSSIPISFDSDIIQNMIKRGMADAVQIIANPELSKPALIKEKYILKKMNEQQVIF